MSLVPTVRTAEHCCICISGVHVWRVCVSRLCKWTGGTRTSNPRHVCSAQGQCQHARSRMACWPGSPACPIPLAPLQPPPPLSPAPQARPDHQSRRHACAYRQRQCALLEFVHAHGCRLVVVQRTALVPADLHALAATAWHFVAPDCALVALADVGQCRSAAKYPPSGLQVRRYSSSPEPRVLGALSLRHLLKMCVEHLGTTLPEPWDLKQRSDCSAQPQVSVMGAAPGNRLRVSAAALDTAVHQRNSFEPGPAFALEDPISDRATVTCDHSTAVTAGHAGVIHDPASFTDDSTSVPRGHDSMVHDTRPLTNGGSVTDDSRADADRHDIVGQYHTSDPKTLTTEHQDCAFGPSAVVSSHTAGTSHQCPQGTSEDSPCTNAGPTSVPEKLSPGLKDAPTGSLDASPVACIPLSTHATSSSLPTVLLSSPSNCPSFLQSIAYPDPLQITLRLDGELLVCESETKVRCAPFHFSKGSHFNSLPNVVYCLLGRSICLFTHLQEVLRLQEVLQYHNRSMLEQSLSPACLSALSSSLV